MIGKNSRKPCDGSSVSARAVGANGVCATSPVRVTGTPPDVASRRVGRAISVPAMSAATLLLLKTNGISAVFPAAREPKLKAATREPSGNVTSVHSLSAGKVSPSPSGTGKTNR